MLDPFARLRRHAAEALPIRSSDVRELLAAYDALANPPRDRECWTLTHTGKAFYPLDPHPEDLDIRDIAHSLAHTCRYNGHVRQHYSVAEHCVVMSLAAPEGFALEALMHDAAETFLSDIARPLKPYLPGYKVIEQRLEAVISERYGLSYPWPPCIHEMDTRILLDERAALLPDSPRDWGLGDIEPLGFRVRGWPAEKAESIFLDRAADLGLEVPA